MAHLESLVILDVAGKSGAALAFGFERAALRAYATREPDDAFSMARTRVPHLVIVTVDGGRSGNEELALIGRLREEAETRELPIVAVGEQVRREEALRAGADEYVTRPAFIRDVLTLAKLAVAVRQDGDEAGVVGMLEDYGLYFLVRALAVAGRSCVLDLERGGRQGEVHLAKGAVVAARAGRMSGVAALQHLMLWGEAALSLRFESPAGERKIVAHVDELLEQGANFAHEFERLAGRVGGAQAIYAQEPRRAAEAREQIPGEVMALVKHYDGRKTLIDIVEDSPFKPFDTIKITYRLAELGAIVRRPEPHEVTPLSAQLAVREWLLGAELRDEAAPRGEPRGVTEAGRRAAEAYAEEEAARAALPSPAEDLLNDTIGTPAVEAAAPLGTGEPPVTPEPAAPREEIHDTAAATSTRDGKRGATARNKKRKSGRATVPAMPAAVQGRPDAKVEAKPPANLAAPEAKVEAKAEAKPPANASAAETKPPANASAAETKPPANAAARDTKAEAKSAVNAAAHDTKAEAKPHAKTEAKPHAARPETKADSKHDHAGSNGVAKSAETPRTKSDPAKPSDPRLSATASAHAPAKNAPPVARPAAGTPAPTAGKLSPQAAAHAHSKEPVFDDLEEDFFARESELAPSHTVDNFDDLEHPRPKLSPKRNWFSFRKK